MRGASLLAVAAVLALACGCGRKEVHVVSSPSGDAVKVTAKGPNGETTQITAGPGAQVKLPAYLPLYPGAVVDSSMTASSASGGGNMVMFHTSAKPGQVIDFYKQKAAAAGFGANFSNEAGDHMMYTAGKEGSDEGLQVVATASGGGSSVQLTWSEGRKG